MNVIPLVTVASRRVQNAHASRVNYQASPRMSTASAGCTRGPTQGRENTGAMPGRTTTNSASFKDVTRKRHIHAYCCTRGAFIGAAKVVFHSTLVVSFFISVD